MPIVFTARHHAVTKRGSCYGQSLHMFVCSCIASISFNANNYSMSNNAVPLNFEIWITCHSRSLKMVDHIQLPISMQLVVFDLLNAASSKKLLYCRSRPFEVIETGTNRKLISLCVYLHGCCGVSLIVCYSHRDKR